MEDFRYDRKLAGDALESPRCALHWIDEVAQQLTGRFEVTHTVGVDLGVIRDLELEPFSSHLLTGQERTVRSAGGGRTSRRRSGAERTRAVVDDSDGQFTRALRMDHTRHRSYFTALGSIQPLQDSGERPSKL